MDGPSFRRDVGGPLPRGPRPAGFVMGILIVAAFSMKAVPQTGKPYDLVISGGRVIDPGTRKDTIASLGIRDGRISAIVPLSEKLDGRRTIDASGLVVAPGFIDIHAHEGVLGKTMEALARNGVTTMIGGNCGGGPYPLADFHRKLERDGPLINYAALCGHTVLRNKAGAKDRTAPATKEQIASMVLDLAEELEAGALGVSFGLAYVPGASYEEVLALAREAARHGGMTAAHARSGEVGVKGVDSFREMIRLAAESGAPHEFSHIGSTLGKSENMDRFLEELGQARSQGIRLSADIYAYAASATGLGSAIAGPGFFKDNNCEPKDIEVIGTVVIDGQEVLKAGSRFRDEDQFRAVREKVLARKIPDPGIIAHIIRPDKIKLGLQHPFVMVGSDGEVDQNPSTGTTQGHPRVAGNFARLLGYWSRDQKVLDLGTALFKSSTQAARFLGLTQKGRIVVGADADLVVFNPDTISDRADFGEGFLTPPVGLDYVIVNGQVIVSQGALVPGARAGKAIRRTWAVPGT